MTQSVIGRQVELGRINALLERVPDSTQVLLIEGEPGLPLLSVLAARIAMPVRSRAREKEDRRAFAATATTMGFLVILPTPEHERTGSRPPMAGFLSP